MQIANAVIVVEMDVTETLRRPLYDCSRVFAADEAMAHVEQEAKVRMPNMIQPAKRRGGGSESTARNMLNA